MNGDQRDREGPADNRPYLCIPYWTKPLVPGGHWDTGEDRPLTNSVVYYLCESIKASPYTPGEDLHVSVGVRNSGGGNSAQIATVVVYWSDPTAGFSKLNVFSATTVSVMPDRLVPTTAWTPTMTAKIPADAPHHICLLAIVSHPQDKAGLVYDPVGDRHWGQRNLVSVTVAPNVPALVPFKLANPLPHDAELELQVAAAEGHHGAVVAGSLGFENADAHPTLRLLNHDGSPISEAGQVVAKRFELDGRGEIELQVMVEMSDGLPTGTVGTVEVLVVDTNPAQERPVVGALGIALLPPN
ncbi:hypothetical protein IU459_30095 [Nocardia amamiensis]|uniref:CARDB domain-containing protein n=1 Tax=Nocardia amamiensis TaxID=404578 RepID=A0ABS0CYT2_9NOCA|nr:hypothetical protein [Nocardia amamiensis]MBF6301763.1 hypothetical protein [Nocardia amamiensis]